ncbi:MAG: peptide-methionine (R)-S-oxide reductase MsrB [Beijerinckiaceae bacterium]
MSGIGGIFNKLTGGGAPAHGKEFPVSHTPEEWKKKLSDMAYYVLREHGTERAGTSPLNREKRDGTFTCAGCGQELFESATKYESGTGWPSFYKPIEGAVETSVDNTLFMSRTEVHCSRCGGHLGHVFPDGPQPTGERYCMNGVALEFKPEDGSAG